MKRTFSPLLLMLVLLSACQQKLTQSAAPPEIPEVPPPVRTIQQIEMMSLEAVNLSEDMSLVSTHNDEIILIAYLLQQDTDSLKILASHLFKDLVFDTLTTRHSLPYKLAPDTGSPGRTSTSRTSGF